MLRIFPGVLLGLKYSHSDYKYPAAELSKPVCEHITANVLVFFNYSRWSLNTSKTS